MCRARCRKESDRSARRSAAGARSRATISAGSPTSSRMSCQRPGAQPLQGSKPSAHPCLVRQVFGSKQPGECLLLGRNLKSPDIRCKREGARQRPPRPQEHSPTEKDEHMTHVHRVSRDPVYPGFNHRGCRLGFHRVDGGPCAKKRHETRHIEGRTGNGQCDGEGHANERGCRRRASVSRDAPHRKCHEQRHDRWRNSQLERGNRPHLLTGNFSFDQFGKQC